MSTPITTLELRVEPIPVTGVTRLWKEQHKRLSGESGDNTHRHYLAGQPVHCGDVLEMFESGSWIRGRYEWTTKLDELPTLVSTSRWQASLR